MGRNSRRLPKPNRPPSKSTRLVLPVTQRTLPRLTSKQLHRAGQRPVFKTISMPCGCSSTWKRMAGGDPRTATASRTVCRLGGLAEVFDARKDSWSKEYQELKKLLPEAEYEAARASTLTSYYTSPEIIRAMYSTLERFGLQGGNILEPSMGVGAFFRKQTRQLRRKCKFVRRGTLPRDRPHCKAAVP